MIFKNKIIKNFSILTGTNLLIQALSILSSIRIARQLQPEGYGLFNLVLLQVSIFSIIAAYGLRLVVIRHLARKHEDGNKIFSITNHIRIITTIIAMLLAIIYNAINDKQSLSIELLSATLFIIIFQTFWDTIESISFGYEKMEISGVINVIFTLIWIAEIYLIPNHLFSVSILIYCYTANQAARSIIFYLWVKRKILLHIPPYQHSGFSDHKEIFVQSNHYFVLALFTAIQNQVPILLLQLNSTLDQIGLFNLGNRIVSPMQVMLYMLLTSLYPLLSRLSIENRTLFNLRIRSLLNIMVITGIWVTLCFALFSRDIVLLLYGKAYINSANVILIQCWFNVLYAIFCTMGTVQSAMDKQVLLARLSVIYAVVSAPIFYFGSKYGAIGLAWAFVIAAFANMTYQWVIFRNLLQKSISIFYTITIFIIIGSLTLATCYYKIEYSFSVRLIGCLVISIGFITYLYNVEYKKLQNRTT